MLTRRALLLPNAPALVGEPERDVLTLAKHVGDLRKALLDMFGYLNHPGALAIAQLAYWTPVLTFATPGNLSVTYSTQVGEVTRIENEVVGAFRIVTSAFTHTTASGALQITGFPYTVNADTGFVWDGSCVWGGITMPGGRTQCNVGIAAASNIILVAASGSAVAATNITAADMPTGGSVVLRGNFRFRI